MFTFSNLFKSFRTVHELMSAEVRDLGPALYRQLLAAKNTKPLHPLAMNWSVQVHLDRDIDRTTVLEHIDISRAIESRLYTGRELAVLKYLSRYIHYIGERVGTVVVIGNRGASFSAYSVLHIEQVATYARTNSAKKVR